RMPWRANAGGMPLRPVRAVRLRAGTRYASSADGQSAGRTALPGPLEGSIERRARRLRQEFSVHRKAVLVAFVSVFTFWACAAGSVQRKAPQSKPATYADVHAQQA